MSVDNQLIWRYLDGDCSPAELEQLEERFVSDANWQKALAQQKALHALQNFVIGLV